MSGKFDPTLRPALPAHAPGYARLGRIRSGTLFSLGLRTLLPDDSGDHNEGVVLRVALFLGVAERRRFLTFELCGSSLEHYE